MPTPHRLALITDRSDSSALCTLGEILSAEEHSFSSMSPEEFVATKLEAIDLAIVASHKGDPLCNIDAAVLAEHFDSKRVIGMGLFGANLFHHLGLELGIGNTAFGSSSRVRVVPRSGFFNPSGDVIQAYRDSDSTVVGVGDVAHVKEHGVPAEPGFTGIAQWERSTNHWPVAQQGSYLLWGFEAPLSEITEDGAELLASAMAYHLCLPVTSLSEVRRQTNGTDPGRYTDSLCPEYDSSRWPFHVCESGAIRATVSWQPSDLELTLILNGPGQTGYLQRCDGVSPLEIWFEAKDEHLVNGSDWMVTVACFGFNCPTCDTAGCDLAEFSIELRFPYSSRVIDR